MDEHNIFILFAVSLLLVILFIFVLLLPRLLHKRDTSLRKKEMDVVVDSFQALGQTLGDEIKSLKEQLVLKERLAALGEVSAGIAHEFRNPMSVIVGYARLLLKSLDETDQRKEIVHSIVNEIEGMNYIMEELLKFSKSEPIKKVDTNLAKSIKDVIQGMREDKCKIDFSCQDDLVIKTDETLLKQAMKNLLRNAIDAGDKVWINIEKSAAFDKEGVFITVKDNGRGIPDGDLNKIFMPFYTTKQGGSGIGLALVQKIVIGHGGNVSAESKIGGGSTFRLFLPLK